MIVGCLIASIALNMVLIAGYVDMYKTLEILCNEFEEEIEQFEEVYIDHYDR